MNRLKRLALSPKLPWLLAALALLLTLPALWVGLRFDDWLHWQAFEKTPGALSLFDSPWEMFSFVSGNSEKSRMLMERGFLPWWSLESLHLSFCRPITVLTHYLDHLLFKNHIWLMHLHSMLWFALCAFLITHFYRKTMGICWAAGLAAFMFVADDAKTLPVAWLANRNTLVAGACCLGVLLAHQQWRKTKSPLAFGLAITLLTLGLFAKEEAISVSAYLFAFALFLDEGSLLKRLLSIAPYAVVIVAWRIAYSLLGYGASGSETYIDPLQAPVDFFLALLQRAPVIMTAQWWFPTADPYVALPLNLALAWSLYAWGFCLLLLSLLWPVLKKDAFARFCFVGMTLSILPGCATFPSDRMLFFPAIGAMGLIAKLIQIAFQEDFTLWRPRFRRPLKIFIYCLIGLQVLVSPIMLPINITGFNLATNLYAKCIRSAPLDESIAEKSLVVVNAPNLFLTSNLFNLNAIEGRPFPKNMINLSNFDLIGVSNTVTRIDEKTVRCRPEKGYRWFLMRNDNEPIPVGTIVNLKHFRVEVTKLTPDGWPAEALFHFEKPLEDPSYVWMRFENMRYFLCDPPAIGETVRYKPYT